MYRYIRQCFVLGPLCFSLLGGALVLSETAALANPDRDSAATLMAEKSDNNGRFGQDHDNGRHKGDEYKKRNDKRGYDKEKRNNRDGRKHDDRYDRRDRDRYHRDDRYDRDNRDRRDRERDRYHNNRGDSKFGLENEHRGFDMDRRSPL